MSFKFETGLQPVVSSVKPKQNICIKAKVKDSNGKYHKLKFDDTKGVGSVPETYKDFNGRVWHNSTTACLGKKMKLDRTFALFIVPQFKTNANDSSTELIWEIK